MQSGGPWGVVIKWGLPPWPRAADAAPFVTAQSTRNPPPEATRPCKQEG